MKYDTAPKVIGDFQEVGDVGPLVPEGDRENGFAVPFVEDFVLNGYEWERSYCQSKVHCLICKKRIGSVDYHGYGFHIKHGYLHYVEHHRVVMDTDLLKAAVKFIKGDIQ